MNAPQVLVPRNLNTVVPSLTEVLGLLMYLCTHILMCLAAVCKNASRPYTCLQRVAGLGRVVSVLGFCKHRVRTVTGESTRERKKIGTSELSTRGGSLQWCSCVVILGACCPSGDTKREAYELLCCSVICLAFLHANLSRRLACLHEPDAAPDQKRVGRWCLRWLSSSPCCLASSTMILG